MKRKSRVLRLHEGVQSEALGIEELDKSSGVIVKVENVDGTDVIQTGSFSVNCFQTNTRNT